MEQQTCMHAWEDTAVERSRAACNDGFEECFLGQRVNTLQI